MAEKIKLAKKLSQDDTEATVLYPLTSADQVLMSDGETTVSDKINEIIEMLDDIENSAY